MVASQQSAMDVMKEDYLLKRKNFSDHLSAMSREMYADTVFTDVTLVSDDMKQVKAHKTVLNAASPVMKELLMIFISCNPNLSPILYIRGAKHSDLEALKEFIYLGGTQLEEERLDNFIRFGKEFRIKDLVDSNLSNKDSDSPTTNCSSWKVNNDVVSMNDDVTLDENDDENELKKESIDEPQVKTEETVMKITENETEKAEKMKITSAEMLRMMNNKDLEPKTCHLCGKIFKSKGSLRQHHEAKHLETQRFNCVKCDYGTARSNVLRNHMLAKHNEVVESKKRTKNTE